MKKISLIFSFMCLVAGLTAQYATSFDPTAYSAQSKIITGNEITTANVKHPSILKAVNANYIGTTFYDCQSNSSIPQRMIAHEDGSISACWIGAAADVSARGTGYNYFDGKKWGPNTTNRIETTKTGWSTMATVGTTTIGEIIVAHDGSTGFVVSTRKTKGSGEWNYNTLLGPESTVDGKKTTAIMWPSIASNGNTIHLIACTDGEYQNVEHALVYFKGTYDEEENKVNWAEPRIIEGTGADAIISYGGDNYNIVANGDNVAILVCNNHSDIFYCLSNDNGENWTKTIIFDNPIENYKENTTLVLDTPFTADGNGSIAIGDDGIVHVAFGITRFLNQDLDDESYIYFPGYAGCVYWNSTMEPIARVDSQNRALDPSYLMEHTNYPIMTLTDLTGDSMLSTLTGLKFAKYGMGMVSMPQLAVKDGKVYWIYTMMLEYPFYDAGGQTGYHFRGVFGIKSDDNGATWDKNKISWLSYLPNLLEVDWDAFNALDKDASSTDFKNTVIYESENVYPVLAKNIVNGKLNMFWQNGYLAGCAIKENNAAISTNESYMYWLQIDADELGKFNNIQEVNKGLWQGITHNNSLSEMKVYPNPAAEKVNIVVASSQNNQANVTINNLLGQVVYSENTQLYNGINNISVNVSSLKSGIYIVNVKTSTGTSTQKLIVK